jgi:hypothetical protein
MAQYAKIINSKNNKVAYCRLFQADDVSFDPDNVYHAILKDGVDVNLERDFVTLPQIIGDEELPTSLDDAILWAFEPGELKVRDDYGTIYHGTWRSAFGGSSPALFLGATTVYYCTYEEAAEKLNSFAPFALLVAGARDAHQSGTSYWNYAYFLEYRDGVYFTTNSTTDRACLVADTTWYDENPNYKQKSLDPTSLLMGYRVGQSLRQLRMEN